MTIQFTGGSLDDTEVDFDDDIFYPGVVIQVMAHKADGVWSQIYRCVDLRPMVFEYVCEEKAPECCGEPNCEVCGQS